MTRTVYNRFCEISVEISPVLHQAITSAGPIKLGQRRELSLPVLLCRAIAGQQLSVKAARTIWGRVVQSANGAGVAEYVAAADAAELRACGMSQNKSKAMKSIVAAHESGRLDVGELETMDHEARSRRLTEIWGVGQWTADMIGISYFADPDIWPEQDVTVWKTLQRLTSRRRKTSLTAARFAPYRTYLALYMWKIADAQPTTP
jgi:DNA-3-methyladenine glycosylase II